VILYTLEQDARKLQRELMINDEVITKGVGKIAVWSVL
jgi:hypothetical protein